MRAPRPLKPATPAEIALHVIDETIRDLLKQRHELAAQLPRRRRHEPTRPYIYDPTSHTRRYFKKEEAEP